MTCMSHTLSHRAQIVQRQSCGMASPCSDESRASVVDAVRRPGRRQDVKREEKPTDGASGRHREKSRRCREAPQQKRPAEGVRDGRGEDIRRTWRGCQEGYARGRRESPESGSYSPQDTGRRCREELRRCREEIRRRREVRQEEQPAGGYARGRRESPESESYSPQETGRRCREVPQSRRQSGDGHPRHDSEGRHARRGSRGRSVSSSDGSQREAEAPLVLSFRRLPHDVRYQQSAWDYTYRTQRQQIGAPVVPESELTGAQRRALHRGRQIWLAYGASGC